MANILVTGGNGFIGSHLVDDLARDGRHRLTVLDDRERAYDAPPPSVAEVRARFSDARALSHALRARDVDLVFHIAWKVAQVVTQPADEDAENVAPTRALIEACARAGVRRFVFASSAGVYGASQKIHVSESDPAAPINSYARAKLDVEEILRSCAEVEHVILRLSSPYGPRQNPHRRQGVVNRFVYRVMRGLPVTMRGDGTAVRDYPFIEDMVAAMTMSADAPAARNQTLNLAGSRGYTLEELLSEVEVALARPATIEREPANNGEISRLTLDTSRVRALTGWSPTTSLREGISKTAAWIARAFPD